MVCRNWIVVSFLGLLAGTAQAGDDVNGIVARVEYALKTPRSRDPVLGGARDKVFVSVWIPAGVKIVRGAVCNPFSKGDSVSAHWQAACRHWQFAYVQVDFDAVKKDEFTLLARGLTELARKTGHPELEHLPLCFLGMSRGGGMSMQLAELMPERTLASVPVCLEVGPSSDVLTRLPIERKQGARYGIAVQWGQGHEFARANNISFVFLDDVLARRLPKEIDVARPVKLAEIPLEAGWLGDPSSWGKDGRSPTIAGWKEFKGDREQACWFPSQRTAAVWQAFVAGTNEVVLEQPAGLGDKQKFTVHPAGKPLVVKVNIAAKLKPAKVEIWDAHERLAQRTEAPWTFDVSLRPGIHSLFATVEASGEKRTSKPNTVVAEQ